MPEKRTYSNAPLSIDEQIDLLISRGLRIRDRTSTAHYLRNIGYYRLGIYAQPLLDTDEAKPRFRIGTTFSDILALYTFDRELRLLVMDAIERIEIALRSTIAHEFSIGAGANWYADPSLFKESRSFSHAKEMTRITTICTKSHEPFIKQHQMTYASLPPSWKLVEALTLGEIERIFFNMDPNNAVVKNGRYRIAQHFGISIRLLLSWFKPICLLRNICAHHGRLWNRKLIYRFELPRHPAIPWVRHSVGNRQQIYAYLCMVEALMKRINPASSWHNRLIALISQHPNIPLEAMSFPAHWTRDPFWSNNG